MLQGIDHVEQSVDGRNMRYWLRLFFGTGFIRYLFIYKFQKHRASC